MSYIETIQKDYEKNHKESALGLFIAMISERKNQTETEHKRFFRNLILSEGYEGFLDAVIKEWMGIKYAAAYRAANPPTIKEVEKKATSRRVERERQKLERENAKNLLGSRILDLVTPNGKALRDCTGNECKKLGGFYTKIAEKVGANQRVGSVLKAEDISKHWKG